MRPPRGQRIALEGATHPRSSTKRRDGRLVAITALIGVLTTVGDLLRGGGRRGVAIAALIGILTTTCGAYVAGRLASDTTPASTTAATTARCGIDVHSPDERGALYYELETPPETSHLLDAIEFIHCEALPLRLQREEDSYAADLGEERRLTYSPIPWSPDGKACGHYDAGAYTVTITITPDLALMDDLDALAMCSNLVDTAAANLSDYKKDTHRDQLEKLADLMSESNR